MPRLDVYQNGAPRFELGLPETGTIRVGRGPDCEVVLPEPLVSRLHLEIRAEAPGHWHVADFSVNGTRLNGEELTERVELHDEDILEIGSYRIFYRVRSAPAGVHPTVRRSAHPTRILEIEGERVRSERAWLEGPFGKVELRPGRQIIGSSSEADVRVDEPFVSRFHAAIFPSGRSWQIEDLDSTNGTFIEGRRIRQAELSGGEKISLGRLEFSFRTQLEEERIEPQADGKGFGALIGESEPMRRLFGLAARVAATDAAVLIHGQSGTGKELLAAALHDHSARAGRPFVPVNCGAIPADLAETELFGHEKGAFTGAAEKRAGLFAEAHRGTLFLDEVGELAPALQVKLLRVLESGEVRPVGAGKPSRVDVRVIAATHRDLRHLVGEGKFRDDLYYRLAVVTLELPPLAGRDGDLERLAAAFLPRGRNLSKSAMEKLRGWRWPGNVRELRNVIERAAIFSDGPEIDAAAIALDELSAPVGAALFERHPELAGKSLEEIERGLIADALRKSGGVQADAAKLLGIAKSSLHGKVERYGLRELVRTEKPAAR